MTVEAGSTIRSCGEWNDDRIEIIIDHSTILADDRIGSLRGTIALMSESGHSPVIRNETSLGRAMPTDLSQL